MTSTLLSRHWSRFALALAGLAQATATGAIAWDHATAGLWAMPATAVGLTSAELWSLTTVTAIGATAWLAAICAGFRMALPAANDNMALLPPRPAR